MKQSENFSGILPPLMPGMMKDTKANFIQLNEALKKKCEAV